MNKQFHRGKQLLTLVIAIMLLTDGVSFWLSRSLLLSWYKDTATQLQMAQLQPQTLDAHAVHRLLGQFVEIDQRNFLSDQGMNYALLILCLVILALGYGWIRWLWGVTWLVKGISGLLVVYLLTMEFDLWTNLVFFGLVTSSLYTVCALTMLCLPSINTYLRVIRR